MTEAETWRLTPSKFDAMYDRYMDTLRLRDFYEARAYSAFLEVNRNREERPSPFSVEEFLVFGKGRRSEEKIQIAAGTEAEWEQLRQEWKDYTLAQKIRRERVRNG